MNTQKLRLVSVTGLALAAGLTLSGCSMLDTFLPSSQPVRSAESGEITEGQDRADVFQIRVGDCMNTSALGDEVTTVPVVPCSESHEDEVYFAFNLDDGEFPGTEVIEAKAGEVCSPEFESFVRTPYLESQLEWYPFFPTKDSWGDGDREVLCVVYDPAGMTVGSLAGVAR